MYTSLSFVSRHLTRGYTINLPALSATSASTPKATSFIKAAPAAAVGLWPTSVLLT